MAVAAAASSSTTTTTTTTTTTSSNYNAYQYDMTDSQFTPDGRLLQVEYAQLATTTPKSNPVVVAALSSDLIVLCTIRSVQQQQQRQRQKQQAQQQAQTKNRIVQERLVVLDNNHNNNNAVVIAMSGVLADCLALLQTIHDTQLSFARWYGSNHAAFVSPHKMAETVATECQWNSFGGGIRTYGASLLIVSNHQNSNTGEEETIIYKTDPSGAIQNIRLHPTKQPVIVTSGGDAGASLQRRLSTEWWSTIIAGQEEQALNNNEKENDNDNENETDTSDNDDDKNENNDHEESESLDDQDDIPSIIIPSSQPVVDDEDKNDSVEEPDPVLDERARLTRLLAMMVEEHQRHHPMATSTEKKDHNAREDDENKIDMDRITAEVVLLSATRGVFKLTPQQIRNLFQTREK